MKLNLDFSLSEIFYTEAISVQKGTLDKNRVLSVLISNTRETIGKIDFTPLAHFHHYTLEEWEYTLDQFFNDNQISLEDISLTAIYFNMIKEPTVKYTGELLFITESVLFAVIEKYSPKSLSGIKNRRILINGLYSTSTDLEKIPDCLKIKIRPTKESLEVTKNLIKDLLLKKTDIRFRLDGNRSFELDELIFFMKELEAFCGPTFFQSVEYLEEPLINHYDYRSFFQFYPYPEALDESLLGFINNLENLKKLPAGTHLVLKPSLFGISKSFELMETAFHTGNNVVVSSSYETKSAIRPLLFLAASNALTCHGLDTLRFIPKELSIDTENFCLEF